MGNKIRIKIGNVKMEAQLNTSKTARLIWDSLPISSFCKRWGEEVYFDVSVKTTLENPKELVKTCDLGYWPEGPSLCIFFGPTPISKGDEIRPDSAVNIIGRLCGPNQFKKISKDILEGDSVQVERVT